MNLLKVAGKKQKKSRAQIRLLQIKRKNEKR
jgi:hypothetical protein